jgi:hypothetical protein
MAANKEKRFESASAEVDNILSQYGTDEAVTDAEAEAVLAEIEGKVKPNKKTEEMQSQSGSLRPETTKALESGSRIIKIAVAHDTNGDVASAITAYNSAVALFSESLSDSALSSKHADKIAASMESYLDRCLQLKFSLQPNFSDAGGLTHKVAIRAMSMRGYSVLKRGVRLYKSVKADARTTEWATFLVFGEAIECLSVYLENVFEAEKRSPVEKCIAEMTQRHDEINAAAHS